MRRPHSGQALIVMLGLITGMLATFILVFNSGQVVNDKIRLTNAVDAAAYSAALWQARGLNYQAYLNRAIVANEVAIAQLVSLQAWSRYVDTLTTNADRVGRYVPYLGAAIRALERGWDAVDQAIGRGAPPLERALSAWNSQVLANAQAVAHQQAPIAAADLVGQVLQSNEPRAELTPATRILQVRNAEVWQHRFTQRYDRGGGDLRRYTALLADSRDGFTRSRSNDLFDVGIVSMSRRGGTDLIGEYAWRGMDTLSLHFDLLFAHQEIPLAWGAAELRRHPVSGRATHGGSLRRNPVASRRATRTMRREDGYQGVPQIRDVVRPAARDQRSLVYSVAARLPAGAVRTLDLLLGSAPGLVTPEGRQESIGPAFSEGALHAMSSAEVYFQRPGARRDGREEFPSLFNPYWQARLVPVSTTDRQLTAGSRGLAADPFALLP
jgi:hypothetical protein